MEIIGAFLLYLTGKYLILVANLIIGLSVIITNHYLIFGFLGLVVMFLFCMAIIIFIPALVFACSAKPTTYHMEGN